MDEILKTINAEEKRQLSQIRLIPSENYVSKDVMRAVGSVLMNKYSEGQPKKRYYQGNQNIDTIELEVKKRALELFGLSDEEWEVNVQAPTGSAANFAVYAALLEPGNRMFSMYLPDGGHLSHGWKIEEENKPVSFTSKLYNSYFYKTESDTNLFDYTKLAKQAKEVQPHILISGGTAYPREIDHEKLGKIAKSEGAYYMADVAHEAGLIAAGVNGSPFEHADVVTMTTRKTLRGPIGALIFARKDLMAEIDRAVFPGLQGGPQNHSIAGIGVALNEAMQPDFKKYATQVILNAQKLADELNNYGYNIVSGGTDKHLLLIDLRGKGFLGKEAAAALDEVGIIVNKNTVPNETNSPWKPSGVRLGTPAITSRGVDEEGMVKIAGWINEVLTNLDDKKVYKSVSKAVKEFTAKLPARGITE